ESKPKRGDRMEREKIHEERHKERESERRMEAKDTALRNKSASLIMGKMGTRLSYKGLPITSTRSAKTKEDVFLITEAAKGDMGFLLILIRKGSYICMMNVVSWDQSILWLIV
nr:hypothetical protein [Tanacetum cinerariifolium]